MTQIGFGKEQIRTSLMTLGFTITSLDKVIQERLKKFPQEPDWPSNVDSKIVCEGLFHIDNALRHVHDTIFQQT